MPSTQHAPEFHRLIMECDTMVYNGDVATFGNPYIEGDSFNYIIPAKFSVLNETFIFESVGDAGLMQTWEEDFAKWNTDNLETLCAMIVPESDIVMVHLEHPVVQLLDKKYEEFNTLPPTEQPNTTPNWRQIHRHTFDRACAWLRDNILS